MSKRNSAKTAPTAVPAVKAKVEVTAPSATPGILEMVHQMVEQEAGVETAEAADTAPTDDLSKQPTITERESEPSGGKPEAEAEPGPESNPADEPETEDENKIEGEGEAESEEKQDEEPEAEAEPAARIPQKRLDREVALRHRAQEEANELRARLAELEGKQAVAGAAPSARMKPPPLAQVMEPAQLERIAEDNEQALEQAETLLLDVEMAPERVESALKQAGIKLADDRGEEDYSPGRMRRWLEGVKTQADRTLRREVPARRAFLQQQAAHIEALGEAMPELRDSQGERNQAAQRILRENLHLLAKSDWPLRVVEILLGREAMVAAKAKGKPAIPVAKTKPPSLPTGGTAPAHRSSAEDDKLTARQVAAKRAQQTGDDQDVLRAIEARLG